MIKSATDMPFHFGRIIPWDVRYLGVLMARYLASER
jgi:hypothetical protein